MTQTRHGHHIEGTSTLGESPHMSKARCGGPRFCDICRDDVARVESKVKMDIQKYTTRPDEVDAIQLTRENIEEVAVWCGGEIITEPKASDPSDVYMALTVPRANGPIDAQVGFYVLKNARGRFEVNSPEIFEKKFGRSYGSARIKSASVVPEDEGTGNISLDVDDHFQQAMKDRQRARHTFFGKPTGL